MITLKKFIFKFSKFVEKLINNNELLFVNEFFNVKIKNYFQKIKNKKEIMTRTEKTKTKFIKQDLFDFKYIKINFCYNNRDDCDKQNNKEIKKIFIINIATVIKVNI